ADQGLGLRAHLLQPRVGEVDVALLGGDLAVLGRAAGAGRPSGDLGRHAGCSSHVCRAGDVPRRPEGAKETAYALDPVPVAGAAPASPGDSRYRETSSAASK